MKLTLGKTIKPVVEPSKVKAKKVVNQKNKQ